TTQRNHSPDDSRGFPRRRTVPNRGRRGSPDLYPFGTVQDANTANPLSPHPKPPSKSPEPPWAIPPPRMALFFFPSTSAGGILLFRLLIPMWEQVCNLLRLDKLQTCPHRTQLGQVTNLSPPSSLPRAGGFKMTTSCPEMTGSRK